MSEPLTARRHSLRPDRSARGDRRGKSRRWSNVRKRPWRNGNAVVGDGMVGRSNEISREICRVKDVDDVSWQFAVGDAVWTMAQALGAVSHAEGERTWRYRRRRL